VDDFIKLVSRLAFLGCLIGSAWDSALVVPACVLMLLLWWD
jgi:hypothetical protein